MTLPDEISVSELARKRTRGDDFLLLDVREADELAVASVAGATHIAMGEIPGRLAEVPRDRDVIVMCHSGGRSGRVASYLRKNGYDRIANLAGGIDAWSEEIDPTVPRY